MAPVAGNTFYLLLAHGLESWGSRETVVQFVEASWPLFLCLYPIRPIAGRSASLARNMRVRGIPKVCEFAAIFFPEGEKISPLCRGEVQGCTLSLIPAVDLTGQRTESGYANIIMKPRRENYQAIVKR